MDHKSKDEKVKTNKTGDCTFTNNDFLTNATDAKLLHLEQSALSTEIEWLLRNEFPYVCRELQKTLSLCLQFIIQSATSTHVATHTNTTTLSSDKSQQSLSNSTTLQTSDNVVMTKELQKLFDSKVVTFESPDKNLKGSVTVEGWHITSADLDITFPKWNKGATFHTTIVQSEPWRLTQLQNVYNYLNLARKELERITFTSSSISETETISNFPHESNEIPQQHLKAVHQLIEQVSTWIKNAQDQILLPSRTTFLNSLYTRFAFHPQLPKDLVIEFGIANKELVVSVYLLKAVPPPQKTNTSSSTTAAQSRTTFFLRNENQHFQIVEQTQVECPMKKLDTIFELIQQAYEQCIEFEEKVNSLSSMNTFFL